MTNLIIVRETDGGKTFGGDGDGEKDRGIEHREKEARRYIHRYKHRYKYTHKSFRHGR